ncbi:MAG: hypothetical protein O6933_04175 [Planctomycetota bacterium]|nr:hypothetical protein [Planctomycetota bacterium]
MNIEPRPNDMAVVATTATEFEAQTKAAVLRSEGIDCTVTCNAPSWTGQVSISATARGATVWVRRPDLERAQGVLHQAVADSVDLDWDEVDVGEREDNLPLRPVGRMPLLAKVAVTVAELLMLLTLLLWILAIIL